MLSKYRLIVVSLLALLLLIGSDGPAMAQSASDADKTVFSGPWTGRWIAPEGWIYEATMTLQLASSGSFTGEINWTLRKAARPREADKLGQTGRERVRGIYYPNSGTLIFEGYEKDDPNTIIGLDKYRLVLSEDRRMLGGITAHGGQWNAQFLLSRSR